MKKFILPFISAIILSGCGVGSYSLSSGKADNAEISFSSLEKTHILVTVDETEYKIETVKAKAYKSGRNIKKTALNTINVDPGQHTVKVFANGNEIFNKKLFISTSEHRIVEL